MGVKLCGLALMQCMIGRRLVDGWQWALQGLSLHFDLVAFTNRFRRFSAHWSYRRAAREIEEEHIDRLGA